MSHKPIAIALGLLAVYFLHQQAWASEERPTISVDGEATVLVVPDKVLITLGVETWEKSLATAKSRNDAAIQQAIAAIRQSGVAASAIETDNLAIAPDWIYPRNREGGDKAGWRSEELIRGYAVSNRFIVTLTQAKQVEEIVSKALAAGVNKLYGIHFQTKELKKHREQARELALHAAKEKAQKMAQALGQSIGEAIQISEGHFCGSSPRMRDNMSQNVVQQASSGSGGADADSEAIAWGKIAIRATVNAVFLLKPK